MIAEPSTKLTEPIPAIIRPGRPPKKDNGHTETVVPPMPQELPRGDWTEQAVQILEERYLLKDDQGKVIETPDQMCWRVAWDVAYAEANFGQPYEIVFATAKDYYRLMVAREFLPNSPTLMNAGKNNGLQYSACFVLPIEDSIDGIFDGIKYQALIHKSGGGTGFSFSRLRPTGSRVGSTKGVASGPVSFMKIYDAATEQVKQGGSRRGANMGILRVDHPDILEFIHCKEDGGVTNFNISVAATDAFFRAYFEGKDYDLIDPKTKKVVGQLSAQKVLDEVANGAWKTGDPGMIFIDKINASTANPVPSLGPVEGTNPCVSGDTLISTKEGLVRMKEVVKSHFAGGRREGGNMGLIIDKRTLGTHETGTVDGRAIKFFDNGVKDTLKLETKSGLSLTATLDHKLMAVDRGWVEMRNLKAGDKILVQSGSGGFGQEVSLGFVPGMPTLPRKWSQELGQVIGWLIGDGWLRTGDKNRRVGFTFGKDDLGNLSYFRKIINHWYGKEIKPVKRVRNTAHLSYHGKNFINFFLQLGVKPVAAVDKEVPESIYTAPREAVIGFLQGLFTADGTVSFVLGRSSYVRLTAKSKFLLKGVQLLLLNLGIWSRIMDRSRQPRKGMFRYVDAKGRTKTYDLDGVCYELEISRDSVIKFFKEVGFIGGRHDKKIEKFYTKGYYPGKFIDEVKSIKSAGKQRVYDLTEERSYTFITNGIVSLDCGEQPLYPFDACNLGSIFLTYFVTETDDGQRTVDWEKLERATKLAVRFLDSVIERNPFPLPQIRDTVASIRRIGLGVGGWADMLIKLGIPYDSPEAVALAQDVMQFINTKGHQASEQLAQERGAFPLFNESIYQGQKPLRNATITTIAPTGTIGIIANASTGIEPLFAVSFQHYVKTNALERSLYFVSPLFEKAAFGQPWYTAAVKDKVVSNGSLAHIEEIPEGIRRLFVTAHDISPDWHVKMQAAFQKGTDNAVSKTINLPGSATPEDIKNAYLQAYESGCLGITVYRDGSKSIQVLNLGTNALRQRPVKVEGATYRIATPLGHAFVTVNHDEEGNPFEVFVTIGKAGSEVAAMAEALGRLISTTLRFGNHLPAKDRAAEIVGQLSGIGGGASVGFGASRVRSLPDAVAKAIAMHFGLNGDSQPSTDHRLHSTAGQNQSESGNNENFKLKIENSNPAKRDLCPSCGYATLVFEEGCSKCFSCGFSKC